MMGDLCEMYFVEQLFVEPAREPVAVSGNASYTGGRWKSLLQIDTGRGGGRRRARMAHDSHMCNIWGSLRG
jgi:hypothetical protein